MKTLINSILIVLAVSTLSCQVSDEEINNLLTPTLEDEWQTDDPDNLIMWDVVETTHTKSIKYIFRMAGGFARRLSIFQGLDGTTETTVHNRGQTEYFEPFQSGKWLLEFRAIYAMPREDYVAGDIIARRVFEVY